jgi:hypothetical protein
MKNVRYSLYSFRAHYFRIGLALSSAALLACACAWAQYGGSGTNQPAAQGTNQAARKTKDAPPLRAVAVLEWTGEETKPGVPGKIKTSRLIPISIFTGEKLEDAGFYLARPQPLALAGQVEYLLTKNGATVGRFDVKNAGQEMGSWVGYGEWKAPVAARPAFAATPKLDDDSGADDDKPVLHRKKHADDPQSSGTGTGQGSANGSGSGSGSPASGSSAGTNSGAGDDSDRPVLHKKSSDDSAVSGSSAGNGSGSSSGQSGSDRPVMKKAKNPDDEDIGHADALPNISDPDRPRLQRGKDNSKSLKVLPSLMGMPTDMRQVVGVSDQKDKPDHSWGFTWANPDDEEKMKEALEDQARIALQLPGQAQSPAKTSGASSSAGSNASSSSTVKRSGTGTAAKKTRKPAPEPVALEAEQFRAFELAYGSGATLVFSARVPNGPDKERYVTLIGQPDLYGGLRVLFKNVADSAHLDETPRMILVDAVDALADNRGELLFELRGATQRQFALYRVARGVAEQIFVTNGNAYGSVSGE